MLAASTKAVAICNNAAMLYFMENRSLCHMTLYMSLFKHQIFLPLNSSLMFPEDWLRVVWYRNLLDVSWPLPIKELMAIYYKSQSVWGLNVIFLCKTCSVQINLWYKSIKFCIICILQVCDNSRIVPPVCFEDNTLCIWTELVNKIISMCQTSNTFTQKLKIL